MKRAVIETVAAFVVAFLLLAGAFVGGMRVQGWRDGAAQASAERQRSDQLAQMVQDASDNAQHAAEAAAGYAAWLKQNRATFADLEKQAHEYVQANPALATGCRFGPDVLRVWRAANAGQPAAAPGDRAGQPGR